VSQVSPSTQIGEDPPAQCSAKIRKCDCDTGTAYGSVFEENWGTVPFNKRKRVKHCSDGEIAILYAGRPTEVFTGVKTRGCQTQVKTKVFTGPSKNLG